LEGAHEAAEHFANCVGLIERRLWLAGGSVQDTAGRQEMRFDVLA
jgi:hypothetical protein